MKVNINSILYSKLIKSNFLKKICIKINIKIDKK